MFVRECKEILVTLRSGEHLCCLYDSCADRDRIVALFFASALQRGELCIYVADKGANEALEEALSDAGIDSAQCRRQKLLIPVAVESLTQQNRPVDAAGIARAMSKHLPSAAKKKSKPVRIALLADLILTDAAHLKDLVVLEREIEKIVSSANGSALCLYGLQQSPPEILRDALVGHKTIILKDNLYQNFYYLPGGISPDARLSREQIGHWLESLQTESARYEEVVQSYTRYIYLFNCLQDGVALIRKGRVEQANPALARMFGYNFPDELAGTMLVNIASDAEVHELQDHLQALTSDEPRSSRFTVTAKRRDGSTFPAEISLSRVYARDYDAVMAIVRDITEEQEIFEALRSAREFSEQVIETAAALIIGLNPDGNIVLFNRACEELTGYNRDEIIGHLIFDTLIPPEWRERVRAVFDSLKKGKIRPEYFENPWLTRSGEQRLISWSNSYLVDENGKPTLVLSTGIDITERKRAEEELFRATARYRALVDASEDYIFVLDRDLRYLHVNEARRTRFGADPAEAIGKSIYAIVNKEIAEFYGSHFRRVFETGKPVRYEDQAEIRGEMKYAETVVSPIFSPDGTVEAIVGISRDITQRKRIEHEQERLIHRHTVFASLSNRLSQAQSVSEIATIAMEEAAYLFAYDAFYFQIFDPDKNLVRHVLYTDTIDGEKRTVPPFDQGWEPLEEPREIYRGKSRLILRDKPAPRAGREDIKAPLIPFGDEARPSLSLMIVPLRREDRVVGALSIQSYSPQAYSEADLETMNLIGEYCGSVAQTLLLVEALQRAAEQWSQTFDAMHDCVSLIDPDCRVLRTNRATAEFLGLDYSQIIGVRCKELFHFSDEDCAFCPMSRMKETLVHEASEQYMPQYQTWMILSVDPIRNDAGALTGAVHVMRDITMLKSAHEKIRESEERYRGIVESSLEAICEMDPTGEISFCNQQMARMLGAAVGEIVGYSFYDLVDPDSCEPLREHFAHTISAGRKVDELAIRWASGKITYCLISSVPLLTSDGKVRAIACFFVDITERRAAEQALIESENRFKTLAVESPLGVVMIHRNRFSYANPAYARLTGYTIDELNEMDSLAIIAPEAREGVEKIARLRLAGKDAPPYHETIYLCKDATRKNVAVFAALTEFKGERAIICSVQDITEQRRVQQEREILARLAQRLVFANTPGEVAHFARDAALSLFDFHAFFFDTFDESTQKYANVLAMDTVEDVLMTVTMESPAPSESVRQSMQGKPVLINREPAGSLEHFALFGSMRPSMSLMYVPVKREQRVVGILSVQSYTPHRYTDKDLMVLIQLADLCAVALEKSRFYAALEQSEERYRAVIESANDAIYTKDTERRYTSANPKTLEIFGLSADQLLGKREEELVEEKHAKSARQSDEHVLKTGESIEATERIRRSGRDYILHIVKAPQRNETGKVVGIIGIARDVTELMGAQEQLRRLSNAIEQATEAIVILNQQRIVEYVNPAFTEITGYAPAEVIGNNLDILWSGKHPIEFFEEMWRTAEAGETWSGSIMNRKKDGSLYEEETTLTPVRNAQGAIVNFVEVKRDVTRERELERQLLLAQKMEAIGTLAGGIAHDFNNLLTGVIGYAQLAREQLGENHPCAPDLDQILGGAERAASLTRQLLAFSRRQIIEPTAVNLNHVVNDLLKMLRRVIGESIEITVALAPTLKAIKVDPGQIEQVLMNLCVNARDAMPKGGVLKIETATVELGDEYRLTHPWIYPGEYTLLTVSDTGVGMTEAVRQRIFEPFFTTKEVGRGTGLGLAVVYGIVRQHDGFIHVYSEPGHGTAFKIYFPVREEEDITAIHRDVQLTVGGTETILIAEDEEPVRELMQRILQSFGYKILLAKDGEEAIQVLAEHKDDIDLAILDLVMPRIGGAAIYKSIRSVRRGLKVLFISGYASTSLEDTTVRISGMPFLSKPFTPTALIQRVRSVLDSPPPTDNS